MDTYDLKIHLTVNLDYDSVVIINNVNICSFREQSMSTISAWSTLPSQRVLYDFRMLSFSAKILAAVSRFIFGPSMKTVHDWYKFTDPF